MTPSFLRCVQADEALQAKAKAAVRRIPQTQVTRAGRRPTRKAANARV